MSTGTLLASQASESPGDHAIRVLHVITDLDRGGAENHIFTLITHANRRRFHLEVAVLRSQGELVEQFRSAGVPVHVLDARGQLDLGAIGRLARLLRERKVQVIHSHLFRADIYASLAADRLGRDRPFIVSTRHNDDRFFLNPFVGLIHYLLSARQDRIIAISDHIARFTIARGVWDRRRVRRVYHGLDPRSPEVRERERSQLREEFGVPASAFLVGNVGRLARQKGQRHLVSAMPLLLREVPEAHLVIAGGGDLQDYLSELAAGLGVADRVHVLGPRQDVPALMRAIDVFAMPSIWEGFGIVLLEAMALSRPIVASRVATIPEVVLHEQTGLLVPPAEPAQLAAALACLAHDPELAQRMGEAGNRRLQECFTLEKMVGDTETIYEELVSPTDD